MRLSHDPEVGKEAICQLVQFFKFSVAPFLHQVILLNKRTII